ncbi:iron-containing redox enzyme family protein [Amazonocrinis nigriterrae]|nr:iron-containing redox enzyme family protein [Amazonocrinis nigriterrae]
MSATQLELLDISYEINSRDEETINKLVLESIRINQITLEILVEQKTKLNEAEKSQVTPIAQNVTNYMLLKMQEINELLYQKKEQGKITYNGYISYLIQAWYCSSYTPELQNKFNQLISQYSQTFNEDKLRRGSKLILMMESDSNEEIGHEIFALQDLQKLGIKQFNISHDIFDESKQLITTQLGLLDQSKFIGFLGYCFYMEFLFAKYIDFQLKLLREAGIPREAQTFLFNHYVIDLSHAGHDIELLNFFADSDEIVVLINENIDVVHSLYKGILTRAFN